MINILPYVLAALAAVLAIAISFTLRFAHKTKRSATDGDHRHYAAFHKHSATFMAWFVIIVAAAAAGIVEPSVRRAHVAVPSALLIAHLAFALPFAALTLFLRYGFPGSCPDKIPRDRAAHEAKHRILGWIWGGLGYATVVTSLLLCKLI